MVEIEVRDALRCELCNDKRQVALLRPMVDSWKKYQICAPCTLRVLGKLIAGRRRGTSTQRTKAVGT
jgi:hypothetical protein